MIENMLNINGRGYGLDSDGDSYEKELIFASSVLSSGKQYYRFVYIVFRDTASSDTTHGYLGIALCNANGSFITTSGGRSAWTSGYASNGDKITVRSLLYVPTGQSWTTCHNVYPTIDGSFAQMIITSANKVFNNAMAQSVTGTYEMNAVRIQTTSGSAWSTIPMVWTETADNANEIVKRAQSLSHLKYWYGGAGQKATQSLLNSLAASYPSIYTTSYKTKCRTDITNGESVGDCSYLVNYAYGTASIGNHGSGSSEIANKYSLYGTPGSVTPKDGMILWRSGHVGIYYNGTVIELKGIDYDYRTAAYKAGEWKKILYDKNRSY